MAEHFLREIDKLKKSLLSVSAAVEESIRTSVRAFSERDAELAQQVIDNDDVIDQMEVEVEEECLKILALHQPVAIDLRFVISVLKINNDLERIADLAANIAARVIYLSAKPHMEVPNAIPKMAELVQKMLKQSLDSLIKMDVDLARKVCLDDDEIDGLHSDMYPFVETKIAAEPERTAEWIQLLGVARYLERAADHTTNIAEDVMYMVEGKIKRHKYN